MARPTRGERPITFRRVDLDATPHDPALRSMLRHGTELEPDPRFARRLRGIVLSRHVAAREGYAPIARRSGMTPIGRGVLVSSVLLALSAGGAGAYSQSAIPDDLLYPLKLRLEAVRMALAPAEMRDELLAMALEERTVELTRAAAAGRWHAAEEAAWRVRVTEEQLTSINGLTPAVAARVDAHLRALDQTLEHAPASSAASVAQQLASARADVEGRGHGAQGTSGNGAGAANGGTGGGQASGAPAPSAPPGRTAAPVPSAPPRPAPSHPAPSNQPIRTERPSASPRPTPRIPPSNGAPGS